MTDLRTAAQQALEALLLTYSVTSDHCNAQWQAITALRAALAEPDEDDALTAAYMLGRHDSKGWEKP